MKKYDVAIVGAGTAGLSARREVAKKTDNYVVIDPGPLGTTCARVGCMPSKVMIHVANQYFGRLQWPHAGIYGGENVHIDTAQVMNHVRSLRDRFVSSVLKEVSEWQAKHLIQRRARFEAPHRLDIEDDKIEADTIIVATGSRPIIPKPWLEFRDFLLDTDSFFELPQLPSSVAVIGLGVIGMELGQALHRLGCRVVGINQGKKLGGLTDPDLQTYAFQRFGDEFSIATEGAELQRIEEGQLVIHSGEQRWKVDKALIAIGRQPNVEKLGLENLSLELDDRGLPPFNKQTFQVSGHKIYFVGDVNADRPILHEAADEGRIAGYNSLAQDNECFQRRTPLGITFSSPQLAKVGQSYKELKDRGTDFITGKVSYEGQGRAIVEMAEGGLAHIYADPRNGRLLGAEMIAPAGEHLAHLIAWAISFRKSVSEILALPYYHPVYEEGLRTAFRQLARQINAHPQGLEILRCQELPAGDQV